MKHNGKLNYRINLVLTSKVLLSCPKKSKIMASSEAEEEQMTSPPPPAVAKTGKDRKSISSVSSAGSTEEAKECAMANGGILQPIYFNFNKSSVRDDVKSVMQKNVEWLKSNPKSKVTIERIVTSGTRRNITKPLASDAQSTQRSTSPTCALLSERYSNYF